jgi:hypothetical protein
MNIIQFSSVLAVEAEGCVARECCIIVLSVQKMQCASCNGELDAKEKTQCYICKNSVHVMCVITKSTKLGLWKSKDYKACQKCIAAAQGMETESSVEVFKGQLQQSGKGATITSQGMAITLEKICFKLDKLDGLGEIKSAVEFIALQYDDMVVKNAEMARNCEIMTNTVQALKEQLTAKDAMINNLMDKVNQLEQESLSKTIEIHGLQQNNGEDICKVVTQLGQSLGLANSADSIDDVYRRRKGYGGRPPIVVVTLQSLAARRKWTDLRKKLRETKNADKSYAVFINEALTYANRALLKKVKELAKEKEYKYVWTRDGQIFARKSDNMSSVKIVNESDALKKLV